MPDRLFIVDVFSLMFQVYHAIPPMTGPKGQPTHAVFGFTRDIMGILRKHDPTHLLFAIDSPGKGVREDWYSDYKANRTEMPEDLRPQIPMIENVIKGFCFPVVGLEGWEADDVIATISRMASEQGMEVKIVSNDKDCRQLLSDKVQMYNCRKDEYFDVAALKETWGITPDQVTTFQGLVGDSVDNVPGVPLIGPKKATALIEQFGTLENILANYSKAPGKKLQENLVTFAEQARISQKLATLNQELPLNLSLDDAKVDGIDISYLRRLFQEYGFRRFQDEVRELGLPDLSGKVTHPDFHLEIDDQENQQHSSSSTSVPPIQKSKPKDLFEWQENKTAPAYIEPLPKKVRTKPDQDLLAGRTWQTIRTNEEFAEFIQKLSQQKTFTFDLETTSLDTHRAKIVGWAICFNAGHAFYLPIRGPLGEQLLKEQIVFDALKPLLENPEIEKCNQNIKYDMLVLQAHGINVVGVGVDPMVAHYLLEAGDRSHGLNYLADQFLGHEMIPIEQLIGKGKKQISMQDVPVDVVAEYATEDADASFRLSQLLGTELKQEGLWDLYWNLERPLISVLRNMEFRGIKVDPNELQQQSLEITAKLDTVKQQIFEMAGREFNIDSPKQLSEILFDDLNLPTQKKTRTGASTDQEVLEKLAKIHPLPAQIIEHRQLSKLKGTYLDALPQSVNPKTGRIHCSFNQVVAATGRLSSNDPNLQNIPIRTEEGRRVRKAFIAAGQDMVLLCADYSQIELRILAEFSQDQELLQAFQQGKDIHTAVAAEVFQVSESAVTSEMRRVAKAVNFGIIYGQSAFGLAETLGIPQHEAATFIEGYFRQYPGVLQFMEKTLDDCLREGYARTISGRRRPIEGIRQNRPRQRNMSERTAINTVIQGSAADLIKQAMLNIEHKLNDMKFPASMLLQIHDELVFEVPVTQMQELVGLIKPEMEHAIKLSVPIVVDVKYGTNWHELQKLS